MKEEKIEVTQIIATETEAEKKVETFSAGEAKSEVQLTPPEKLFCSLPKIEPEQEPRQIVACTEGCNCIIPFCCRYTVPNGFGNVTEQALEKEIFYHSNLYYIIDNEPCTVDVEPPEGCPTLGVEIFPVRIVGCIPYVANVKIASESACTQTATGSTENFVNPINGLRMTLSLDQCVGVNQVVGYVTSPEVSPVYCGQFIPCSEIQVAFIAGPTNCTDGSEDADGTIIEFRGNFKITNCPISDEVI